MPYKSEKLHLCKEDDKRRKLTDLDKQQIKEWYGKISQRKLAKIFDVSRRLIIFIGCPEKHQQNLECRKARGGSKIYYNKDKHTSAMRKHRQRKQELYLNEQLFEQKYLGNKHESISEIRNY